MHNIYNIVGDLLYGYGLGWFGLWILNIFYDCCIKHIYISYYMKHVIYIISYLSDSETIYSHWSIFLDINFKQKNNSDTVPHPLLYISHSCEDSEGMLRNGVTKRLGRLSGKNNSRDWWRAMKNGPVTRHLPKMQSFLVLWGFDADKDQDYQRGYAAHDYQRGCAA